MSSIDRREARLDVRLVPVALTCWAVTAAGILWPVGGAAVALLLAILATVAVACWVHGRSDGLRAGLREAAAGTVAVAVAGFGFAVAVSVRVDEVGHHPLTARYGSVARVVVTPSETPRSVRGGRMMFRGALHAVDADEMSGRVVVFTSAAADGLTAGRPAAFDARITRPTRRDLTVAVLSATGEPTLGEAAPIDRAAQRVRTAFTEAARAALPADQAAMLPALVLGDTSAMTDRTAAEFRTAGLTHLTAVSGANVTIVCGAVLLSAVLVGPRLAVGMAAVALVAFVIVVQPSASVLRAAVMGAITLLAVLSHRRRQAIPALSASVVALMIAAPELAVDIGFALSVSATAALVVIAPAWSARLVGKGWPKPLADAVSVAVAAQLVTAPLVAAISGSFSVVAVIANLLVAIVIPPITVLGTAAAALSVLWQDAASLVIRFTGPELWWLSTVAHHAARLPGAAVPVPAGALGVAVVGAAGLAAVLLCRRWVR